jgi:hypothetical protein
VIRPTPQLGTALPKARIFVLLHYCPKGQTDPKGFNDICSDESVWLQYEYIQENDRHEQLTQIGFDKERHDHADSAGQLFASEACNSGSLALERTRCDRRPGQTTENRERNIFKE